LPGHAGSDFVRPALEATRSLERQIECLYLASAPLRPRPEPVDLRALCAELLQNARRDDARTEADLGPGSLAADADPRFLRAALDVSRLLLLRFGPGGAPRLRCAADADGICIGWSAAAPLADPVPAGPVAAPPPFLAELFERLAARVPARPVLDRLHGAVPVTALLRWPVR
jgi:hypothetical protein